MGHPDRLVCLSPVSPAPCIHRVETQPPQSRDRRNASDMVIPTPLCISPILTEGETRQGTHDADNNTYLANPAMVCRVVANVHEETGIVATQTWSSDQHSRSDPPTGEKQNLKISGLESYRKVLAAEGVSKEASDLITSCRRQGSTSNYESSWRKWASCCSQRQLIHFTVL